LKLRGEVVGYLWGKGLEVVANKGLEVKGISGWIPFGKRA
jgi:hypothetical protein